MTLKFTTFYYIYITLQSWSKNEKWSHSWITVLGDYLTNFIWIQIVWSDGITLLNCFYPLITFDCGRGSDMLSVCEAQTQQALFSCSHFYEIQKKMNLFPDTILQVQFHLNALNIQRSCHKAEQLYKTWLYNVNFSMPSKRPVLVSIWHFKHFSCFNWDN